MSWPDFFMLLAEGTIGLLVMDFFIRYSIALVGLTIAKFTCGLAKGFQR